MFCGGDQGYGLMTEMSLSAETGCEPSRVELKGINHLILQPLLKERSTQS